MKESMENKFEGSQVNMCDAIILGWDNYLLNQSAFQQVDLKYTKEYGQQAIEDIITAKGIPGISPRRAKQVNTRELMTNAADAAIANWLIVCGFIEKLFPANQVPALKNAAGYASYPAAVAYSWSALYTMLSDGSTFINDNLDALLNNGKGMLPGFPEAYAASQQRFNDLYQQYINAKQGVANETIEKLDAVNKVYDNFISMSKDAKKIFRKNKAKKELFTYGKLLAKVAGTRKGGFHIAVRSEGEMLPVTTTTVLFNPGNRMFYANDKGIVMAELKEGTYEFSATTPGYKTKTGILTATKSVMHREQFILEGETLNAAIA